jgi:hypothetical protein
MMIRYSSGTGAQAAIFLAAMLCVSSLCGAAEWSAQPSVRLERAHDNNPLLTVQPHSAVNTSIFAPKVDLGLTSDIWQVTGSAEAVQNRYSGGGDLDSDERRFSLGTSYRTERSGWRLNGTSSKNSALSYVGTDAGAVDTQKIYDTRSISPSVSWNMNELTQLILSQSYSSVSYVDGKDANLNDYSERSTSVQIKNNLNPSDTAFFTAGYDVSHVPALNPSSGYLSFLSRSVSYQAGFTRAFSETESATFSAGRRMTASETDQYQFGGPLTCQTPFVPLPCRVETARGKSSSAVFNAILDKQFETTHVKVSFGRAFDPSALGGQVQTDSQNIALNQQFSSRLAGNFSFDNYGYKSDTDALAASVDRHLYIVQPGLSWMWTPELSTGLTYQYMHVKRSSEDKEAISNSAHLSLIYQWPKMSISR